MADLKLTKVCPECGSPCTETCDDGAMWFSCGTFIAEDGEVVAEGQPVCAIRREDAKDATIERMRGLLRWIVSDEGMWFYAGGQYRKDGGNECVEINYEDFMEVFARIDAELEGDGDD